MRRKKIATTLLLSSIFACTTISCSDSDKSADTPILSQTEQKELIEQTSVDFINSIQSKDLTEIKTTTQGMMQSLQACDPTELQTWVKNCTNSIISSLGTTNSPNGEYNSVYTNYKLLYMASNFTGHFTIVNNAISYTPATDLQFTLPDANQQLCTLSLKTTGNTKQLFIGKDEQWKEFTTENGIGTDHYDTFYQYMAIPEGLSLTMTKGATTLASITIQTDLSSFDEEAENILMTQLATQATFKLMNYTIQVSKAAYAPTEATFNCSISKNDQTLFSFNSSLTGSVEQQTLLTANLAIDLMNKVQLKGACSNIQNLFSCISMANQNAQDETTFKSYISQANGLMNLALYYQGGTNQQAQLKFEPFYANNEYESGWYCEPVLYFQDGTSYSTLNDFFKQEDFQRLLQAYAALIEDFKGFSAE